jgi:hypothetical protein
MINVKTRWAGALAVAAALIVAVPASAQTWSASERTAGLTVDGAFTGLALTCTTSGSIEMVFSGFPARLEAGNTYTVPVTVDGTAFLYEAEARDGGERGFSTLVHFASMGELSGLLDALASGRSAEISSPAGRYVVPLAGSSRALETFRRRCG